MRCVVFCRTRFEGFHRWPDAPDEVAFLRDLHRHEFHVMAHIDVSHDDRECEFILLKRRVDKQIKKTLKGKKWDTETWSCEKWARHLLDELDLSVCEVTEDGENGAVVLR